MQSPSHLIDVHVLAVPAGVLETPLEPDHIVDIHLGDPVRASAWLDGRIERGLQSHGDLSVVPAGVTGRWEMEESATALLLRLTPALLRDTAAGMGLNPDRAQLDPSLRVRDPHLEHLGLALKTERDHGYVGGVLFTESLASAVAARLLCLQLRPQKGASETNRELPKWRLRRVCEYIEGHLDRNLSLAELASVAGFSVSHFKPLFRRAAGLPVHRYVVERRVERVRMLLVQGGRSMAEIALEAGFAHQSHMARWMRRVLGIGPAQVAAIGECPAETL